MQKPARKSNGDVPSGLTSFYAEWRIRSGAVALLRDDRDSPPESLLQSIWQHQRLRRDQLSTLDGRPLKVLHPGFRSVEGGPDFRGAVLQFGDDLPITGEIEVDLRSSGWRAHGHYKNPAFAGVRLHVLWDEEAAAEGGPPAIALRKLLDTPLGQLSLWLGNDVPGELPEEYRGKCCAPLRELKPEQVEELLRQAAEVRLQSKASQFSARARQAGWGQALWEGLFRALGYKHNVWPMQCLGELMPRWSEGRHEPDVLQARLLGISGLLPADVPRDTDQTAARYVRRLWDHWWREQDAFGDCRLPRTVWRLHGLRPANNPLRRLALASNWCAGSFVEQRVQEWCARLLKGTEPMSPQTLAHTLAEALQPEKDPFWSWHLSLKSPRSSKPHPLLGETRATDVAINVIIPWLWARTEEGGGASAQAKVKACYDRWPAAEDNSLLRQARQRLLGGAHRGLFQTAAAQQGLLQITRDFCDHSNAICDKCQLPEMVQAFRRTANTNLQTV